MRTRRPKELHDFTGILKGETEFALRFDFGTGSEVWLPKSQVEWEKTPDGKGYEVTIPDWLVEEKGLKS
jgi:hypothetical protein